MWQQETEGFLLGDPQLREALKDPRRVFNQDETAVEVGIEICFVCFLIFILNRSDLNLKEFWLKLTPRFSTVSLVEVGST